MCNVRGALVPCLSLTRLLGLSGDELAATASAAAKPRILILQAGGGPLVVPVDEVDGVHALPEALLAEAARNGGQPASRLAHAVLQWQGRGVTWLDETRLERALLEGLG